MRTKLQKDKKEPTWEEMSVAIGEFVKDKPAFVTEVLKLDEDRLEPSDLLEPIKFLAIAEAKVKEVKIDGQQAKSQVTFPGTDGKESKGTIYFKLESGVWKIDLIETDQNWPRPPPSPQVQPHPQPQATPSYSRPGLLRRLLDRLRNW